MTRAESDKKQIAVIAKNIMRMLSSHEMTQLELAKLLGVTESAVSRWTQGLDTPHG